MAIVLTAWQKDYDYSTLRSKLEVSQSKNLIVGNSMVGEGIDETLISSITASPTQKIYLDGAASAWWYLLFKRFVTTLKNPPRTVIFLFRDTIWTQPQLRTRGRYSKRFANMGIDARFAELVRGDGFFDQLMAERDLDNTEAMMWLESQVARIIAWITKRSVTETRQDLAELFSPDKFRKKSFDIKQQKAEAALGQSSLAFTRALKRSFLPDIIKLANSHGIKLAFVRLERQQYALGSEQPESLRNYIFAMQRYLETEGAYFIDYVGKGVVGKSDFGDGDHLNESGRQRFSTALAKTLLTEGIIQVLQE